MPDLDFIKDEARQRAYPSDAVFATRWYADPEHTLPIGDAPALQPSSITDLLIEWSIDQVIAYWCDYPRPPEFSRAL